MYYIQRVLINGSIQPGRRATAIISTGFWIVRVDKNYVAQLCLILCNPMDCSPPGLLCPWDFPGKNTGVGCHCI